ncbi:hypothetical protein D1007_05342 [Hordeum vulgare]|nr:hypothetical protein D1007_05342 [Hordeum vulgare]
MAGEKRGIRVWRLRSVMVSPPRALAVPTTVALLPTAVLHSSEARAEMLRVVRGKFPDRARWPGIMVEIIRMATFVERARFRGDDGGMDYELIYWAMREAESTDPTLATKWRRFKTTIPFHLNVDPPPVVELSQMPPEVLPPGVNPPRAC